MNPLYYIRGVLTAGRKKIQLTCVSVRFVAAKALSLLSKVEVRCFDRDSVVSSLSLSRDDAYRLARQLLSAAEEPEGDRKWIFTGPGELRCLANEVLHRNR